MGNSSKNQGAARGWRAASTGSRRAKRPRPGRYALAALLILSAAGGIFAVYQIASTLTGYDSARQEYDALRQEAPAVVSAAPSTGQAAQTATPPGDEAPSPALSAINPDYIGWLRIEGTAVDYPVVRGENNERYLNTTFSGKKNSSGAIFMDYRCVEGFDAAAAILYGHNMKDGSMFADLARYLEGDFLAKHPEISLITPNGNALLYRIFSARVTDVNDPAYAFFDPQQGVGYAAALGAPAGAGGILVLSTCTDVSRDTQRLIVLAAREKIKNGGA